MNEFNTWYLALLRKQVEDEIQFLIANGHHEVIYSPCMFCAEYAKGTYLCRRLSDLKQFLSSIASHEVSKPRPPSKLQQRRSIGFEAEISENQESGIVNGNGLMPLLSIKL